MKVALHLTHDCNLRCTYCYVGQKYDRRMTAETAEKAVRFGFAQSTQRLDLSFFGGEPLLEKDLLFHTVEYATSWRREQAITKPLRFFVTTNGTLLDEAFLTRARQVGLTVSLSLDGHGKGHDLTRTLPDGSGSFARLAPLFPLIQRHFPGIEVLVTFTPRNLPLLATGIRDLYKEGFRNFILGPNYEEDWSPESLLLMETQYRELGGFYRECFERGAYVFLSCLDSKIAAHTRERGQICSCCDKNDGEIAVAPSGNLYPCLRFVKDDADDTLRLGSLDGGLDRKARARLMLEAGREWEDCRSCAHLGRCFHYCSAVNAKVTGRFNAPPPVLCHHERLSIAVADEVAGALYHEGNAMFLERFYR